MQPLSAPNTAGSPLRGVGLVNSLDLYDPYNRFNPLDDVVTAIVVELSNWAFPQAAVYGDFKMADLLGRLLGGHYSMPPGSLDDPSQKASPVLDWLGVNYYTRWLVQFNPKGWPDFRKPPGPTTDIGRVVYPEGTERILRDTAAHVPGLPLVMTENGVSDAADKLRPQFISDTLHYLDLTRFGHNGLQPIDVRGYYHWTLTDDFEWQWGYFSRYGLFQILYDQNIARVPRNSAGVYRTEILARR